MSRWELLAKSLCRTAAPQTALCARQLLQGEIPSSQLKRLLEAYNRRSGERIFISAEQEALTPETLREKALRHRARRGRSPVVVVDYLQILAPSDARGSDKQNVHRAVVALKALSRGWKSRCSWRAASTEMRMQKRCRWKRLRSPAR